MSTAILWFRRDFRLADNPALTAALKHHDHVIPVYLHAPHEEAPWQPGAASLLWLHHSLAALESSLDKVNNRLVLRKVAANSSSLAALKNLIADSGAEAVYWNRLYEPAIISRDKDIKQALKDSNVLASSHAAALLFEPWEIKTGSGGPYRVFTPFWKNLKARDIHPPQSAPDNLPVGKSVAGESIESLQLRPTRDWKDSIEQRWQPGEQGAMQRLDEFLGEPLKTYDADRNIPAVDGTSGLSPHLHFGEISPRQIWHAARAFEARSQAQGGNAEADKFLSEVGWREFAHHLLYHYPETTREPMNDKFKSFPWRSGYQQDLQRWQRGQTGIPIVDAGMRELWATGVMHNRVRMLVASLLTKNLLIHWHEGAQWFWDTLVDADLASNSLGWQWVAGSGADAAPYFRIFNPVLQGEKFDPQGDYVRHWVPEFKQLPKKFVHKPWEASKAELQQAGILFGSDYPEPICDLKPTRQRALDAYQEIK